MLFISPGKNDFPPLNNSVIVSLRMYNEKPNDNIVSTVKKVSMMFNFSCYYFLICFDAIIAKPIDKTRSQGVLFILYLVFIFSAKLIFLAIRHFL